MPDHMSKHSPYKRSNKTRVRIITPGGRDVASVFAFTANDRAPPNAPNYTGIPQG